MSNINAHERKIMIVDDEPNIALAIQVILSGQGYNTATASNAQECLEALQSFRPHLLLLDVMMPGMDGFSLAKSIRGTTGLQDCPIIFITAKGTSSDKMEGYDAGAEAYIVKPFDNDVLLQKVEDALAII